MGTRSDSFIATCVRWSFLTGRESGKHFLQKLLCVNNVSQDFRAATRFKTDLANSMLLPLSLAPQWLQVLKKCFPPFIRTFSSIASQLQTSVLIYTKTADVIAEDKRHFDVDFIVCVLVPFACAVVLLLHQDISTMFSGFEKSALIM